MRIDHILRNKKTLSFELFPPVDEKKINDVFETSKFIKGFNPDFVSITDSKKWGKMKHIALAKILKEEFDFNIMIHIKCIDKTKNDVESMLNEMRNLKFRNILALKGDEDKDEVGNLQSQKFFKNSLDLLKIIPSFFCCAIALYPASHPDTPIERELELIKKKIELGAKFGITQMFLDPVELESFLDRLEKNSIKIPVIAGIIPATSYRTFKKTVIKASNISIPNDYKKIIERFSSNKSKDDFFKASVDYLSNMIEKILKMNIAGIHFFTLNTKEAIEEIIKRTKLWKKLN